MHKKAGKKMKKKFNWKKFENPIKVELVNEIILEHEGEMIAKGSKDSPISGIVTHYSYKKIGNFTLL